MKLLVYKSIAILAHPVYMTPVAYNVDDRLTDLRF